MEDSNQNNENNANSHSETSNITAAANEWQVVEQVGITAPTSSSRRRSSRRAALQSVRMLENPDILDDRTAERVESARRAIERTRQDLTNLDAVLSSDVFNENAPVRYPTPPGFASFSNADQVAVQGTEAGQNNHDSTHPLPAASERNETSTPGERDGHSRRRRLDRLRRGTEALQNIEPIRSSDIFDDSAIASRGSSSNTRQALNDLGALMTGDVFTTTDTPEVAMPYPPPPASLFRSSDRRLARIYARHMRRNAVSDASDRQQRRDEAREAAARQDHQMEVRQEYELAQRERRCRNETNRVREEEMIEDAEELKSMRKKTHLDLEELSYEAKLAVSNGWLTLEEVSKL